MDWISLPQELNSVVSDMVVYQGKLVACGRFTASGSTVLKHIAAWDGTQWTSLGRGIVGDYVMKMLVLNNELYAVGQFDSAGTVASQNVAKWNGTSWISLNIATNMNAAISTITAFNNEVYVGGGFNWINNVSANGIAKYNGSNWQALGTGVSGGGNTVNDFCVYNNGLYISGAFWGAGGVTAMNIAMWDGSAWHGLSTSSNLGTSIFEWNGKLLYANNLNPNTNSEEVHQWDGANWSVFSQQDMRFIKEFYNFNNKLYCAKSQNIAGPTSDSYVYVWDAAIQTWVMVGTGINLSVFALCEYNGALYCGGGFDIAHNASHNYMAKLSYITGITKNTFEDGTIKYFPNPVTDKLNLEFTGINTEHLKLSICNTLGQNIINHDSYQSKTEVDVSFLKSGIYYLKVENEKSSKVFKIVKQ